MHWTLSLMIVLVAWAYAGMWRRPASGVLALLWCGGQLWWYVTGESVPIPFYVVSDMALLAALLLWGRTWLDVAITVFLVAQWGTYFAVTGLQLWWTLYVLAALQMASAGPWHLIMRQLHRLRGFTPIDDCQWSPGDFGK